MKLILQTVIFIQLFSFPALAQKQQTDREADGLKGAVKTVLAESAELVSSSGKLVEQTRKIDSNISYDTDGNRTAEKLYESGVLFSSTKYSTVDGSRVSIVEDVDNGSVIVVSVDNPSKQSNRRSDGRYTYKLKYKYGASGIRQEEAMYQNNGRLWQKRVYKTKGNKKEELVYAEDGSLNQKYVYTLDDKGNEVEMLSYDTQNNSIDGKETYAYLEFDSNGNWTKRITSEPDTANGKTSIKQTKATYRTITYY